MPAARLSQPVRSIRLLDMIAISALQDRAHSFEENRGRIWRVAYRMLGSRAEADDVVQDAYLRWHHALVEEIRAPQAWLVTTVTRIAIDRLRQLRAERDFYTGPWLPDPIVTEAPPADERRGMASELSVAFMAVLERLAPEERAAFLLHESSIRLPAILRDTLGKTETACRQIVSRARQRVRAARPRVRASADVRARLLDRFVDAIADPRSGTRCCSFLPGKRRGPPTAAAWRGPLSRSCAARIALPDLRWAFSGNLCMPWSSAGSWSMANRGSRCYS